MYGRVVTPPPDFAISPTAPMKYGPIESQISKTLSGGLLQSTRKSQCLGLWFVQGIGELYLAIRETQFAQKVSGKYILMLMCKNKQMMYTLTETT